MSLKDNVDYVKKELDTEEKFLESFVKVERFYKKNRLIIIVGLVIIIGGIIGLFTVKSFQEQNRYEANVAFSKLLENPKDQEALTLLKDKNIQLYQIAQYMQAKSEGKSSQIEVKFFKEIAAYQEALNKNDITKLNSISMQNDFLLKEFAIFNKALILTENGKYEDAKAALKLIPVDSKVSDLVSILNHYLATK